MSEKLSLKSMKRNWAIYPVTAIKEEENNLDKAMQWLIDNIDDTMRPKKIVKYGWSKKSNVNDFYVWYLIFYRSVHLG